MTHDHHGTGPPQTAVPAATTIGQALVRVPSRWVGAAEAGPCLYAGLPPEIRFTTVWDAPQRDFYVWTGGIEGKTGTFIAANMYPVAAVQAAMARSRAPEDVLRSRSGLTALDVGLHCVCCAEIDDIPLAEQAARLDCLEHETGLRFGVVALSGDARPEVAALAAAAIGRPIWNVEHGKSIHAYLSIEPTDAATWLHIQKLLVVLLRSDPAITNSDRLMRLPGAVGHLTGAMRGEATRVQTCLRAERVSHTGAAVISELTALAVREGITDLDAAFSAIEFGEGSRKLATGKSAKSLALTDGQRAELLEMAASAKAARAVTPFQQQRYDEISHTRSVDRKGGQSAQPGGSRRRCELPHGTLITLATGAVVTMHGGTIPAQGVVCYDPVLESPGRSTPSARIWSNGTVFSSAASQNVLYVEAPMPAGERAVSAGLSPECLARIVEEHAADVAEGELRALRAAAIRAPHAEHLAKRAKKAAALNPAKVELAQLAVDASHDLEPIFRRHLLTIGAVERVSGKACGSTLVLTHVRTGEILLRHLSCKKMSCLMCGSKALAIKTAGSWFATPTGVDGSPLGGTLDGQPAYRYRIAASQLAQWARRFRRVISPPLRTFEPVPSDPATWARNFREAATPRLTVTRPPTCALVRVTDLGLLIHNRSTRPNSVTRISGLYPPVPGPENGYYIAYGIGAAETVILSNVPMAAARQGSTADGTILPTYEAVLRGRKAVRAEMLRRTLDATQARQSAANGFLDLELDSGQDLSASVVECNITSSQSISLNPDNVWRTHLDGENDWVRMDGSVVDGDEFILRVKAHTADRASRGLAPTVRLLIQQDDAGRTVRTGPLLDPIERATICALLREDLVVPPRPSDAEKLATTLDL